MQTRKYILVRTKKYILGADQKVYLGVDQKVYLGADLKVYHFQKRLVGTWWGVGAEFLAELAMLASWSNSNPNHNLNINLRSAPVRTEKYILVQT